MADANLVAAVLSLPPHHRAALIDQLGIKVSRNAKAERKVELIADALAKKKARPDYVRLYLGQAASIINFYKFDVPFNIDAMEAKLRKQEPALFHIEGAKPKLTPQAPPRLHRAVRVSKEILALELAALDPRHYRANWLDEEVFVDHIYRVAIKNDPPTIELRSVEGKAEFVTTPLSAVLGVSLNGVPHVKIDRAKETALKARLRATGFRAYGKHEHKIVNRSIMEANPDADLQGSDAHEEWLKAAGVKEIAHAYKAKAPWTDGYEEVVRYRIDRSTGQMSLVGSGVSEVGIDLLRRNVVAL